MSILSSTRSGYYARLTKAYLLSHGYVQKENTYWQDGFFYRHHLYNEQYIRTLDYNGELMFYVYFTGSRHNNQGHVYLTSISALKELEQMWDETSSMKKGKLKRKLLEKYNKIQ